VAQPIAGFVLLAAAVGLTAYLSWLFNQDPDRLLRPWPIYAEIGVGTIMLLADTWIFGFADHRQTVPSVWVVGAVGSVAIAGGRRAAVTTGLGMGLAQYVGLLPFADSFQSSFTGLATMVLLGVSGWVLGYLLRRLRQAERSISAYRAREEVARTLHDGVLQTLAVIQRRSHDQELVALARTQEAELRHYLFGGLESGEEAGGLDLATALRGAARRAENRYQLKLALVLDPELPRINGEAVDRLAAAVGEALNNAVKHGEASAATIYAEPCYDDSPAPAHGERGRAQVFVSVKDNGRGFEPGEIVEGEGLRRSIRGRLTEVGGRVEIDGRPGRGTEVRMWL
jgi:signal transduction histidine kinase